MNMGGTEQSVLSEVLRLRTHTLVAMEPSFDIELSVVREIATCQDGSQLVSEVCSVFPTAVKRVAQTILEIDLTAKKRDLQAGIHRGATKNRGHQTYSSEAG